MIDLKKQYLSIQSEIDDAIAQCLQHADFINGASVKQFEQQLSAYTSIEHCVACGNGTDALQIALMALNLPKGSKVIVPAFTYIAPIEVVALLGYELVFADVELDYSISLRTIKEVYSNEVKAIIIVHLFGQPVTDIDSIYSFCLENNLALIEDNAQSLGAEKNIQRNSLITTSFYPTKNLGGYGDGGAILTHDTLMAKKIRQIASHGQTSKYIHEIVGVNSRLDTIQAAILLVKFKYLDDFNNKRRQHAAFYIKMLKHIADIELPEYTTNHIFHQFTIQIKNGKRDELKDFLKQKNIQTIINYPLVGYRQKAFLQNIYLENAESHSLSSLSIPVHPELSTSQLSYICDCVIEFFTL